MRMILAALIAIFHQSVLSGLNPAIISEICGRRGSALLFAVVSSNYCVEQCRFGNTKCIKSSTSESVYEVTAYLDETAHSSKPSSGTSMKRTHSFRKSWGTWSEKVVFRNACRSQPLRRRFVAANGELGLLNNKVAGQCL